MSFFDSFTLFLVGKQQYRALKHTSPGYTLAKVHRGCSGTFAWLFFLTCKYSTTCVTLTFILFSVLKPPPPTRSGISQSAYLMHISIWHVVEIWEVYVSAPLQASVTVTHNPPLGVGCLCMSSEKHNSGFTLFGFYRLNLHCWSLILLLCFYYCQTIYSHNLIVLIGTLCFSVSVTEPFKLIWSWLINATC